MRCLPDSVPRPMAAANSATLNSPISGHPSPPSSRPVSPNDCRCTVAASWMDSTGCRSAHAKRRVEQVDLGLVGDLSAGAGEREHPGGGVELGPGQRHKGILPWPTDNRKASETICGQSFEPLSKHDPAGSGTERSPEADRGPVPKWRSLVASQNRDHAPPESRNQGEHGLETLEQAESIPDALHVFCHAQTCPWTLRLTAGVGRRSRHAEDPARAQPARLRRRRDLQRRASGQRPHPA